MKNGLLFHSHCQFFVTHLIEKGSEGIIQMFFLTLISSHPYCFYGISCTISRVRTGLGRKLKNWPISSIFQALKFRNIEKTKLKINFFSSPSGARELKLQSYESESKTTSGCSNSLISKIITLNSLFSLSN